MNQPRFPRLPQEILDEATAWFSEFCAGEVSVGQRRRFIAWLRTSPENVRAYLQITAHWEEARTLGNRHMPDVDALVALARADTNTVVSLASADSGARRRPRDTRAPQRRPVGSWIALAAALALAALGGGYWWSLERNTYSTGTGEQHSVTLDDGTSVELNARSSVRVAFRKNRRDLYLTAGQALFRVAKDATRPFVVHTGDTEILAVGTQFDVYRKSEGTIVTVLEGSVAVEPASPGPRAQAELERPAAPNNTEPAGHAETPHSDPPVADKRILLLAGDQATVSARGAISAHHVDDASVATAWTKKEIILRNTPLTEVVAEFNRYNAKPLVIVDPRIAATHISGNFSSDNPDALLRGLESLGKFEIHAAADHIEISGR